jgi:hypothetical protein
MEHVEINYLAVLVSGILAMVVGSLWYGPLFGNIWMKEEGFTEEDLTKDFNPAKTYGLTFIAALVVVYVLARVLGYIGAEGVVEGLRTAFLCWLGFIAATKMTNYLFERKTLKLFLINAFYHLVNLVIASVILSVWK